MKAAGRVGSKETDWAVWMVGEWAGQKAAALGAGRVAGWVVSMAESLGGVKAV